MNEYLVAYIENDIFDSINNEGISDDFKILRLVEINCKS